MRGHAAPELDPESGDRPGVELSLEAPADVLREAGLEPEGFDGDRARLSEGSREAEPDPVRFAALVLGPLELVGARSRGHDPGPDRGQPQLLDAVDAAHRVRLPALSRVRVTNPAPALEALAEERLGRALLEVGYGDREQLEHVLGQAQGAGPGAVEVDHHAELVPARRRL